MAFVGGKKVRLIQGGENETNYKLLRGVGNRLERLARKMLRRFPSVRRWAEKKGRSSILFGTAFG